MSMHDSLRRKKNQNKLKNRDSQSLFGVVGKEEGDQVSKTSPYQRGDPISFTQFTPHPLFVICDHFK